MKNMKKLMLALLCAVATGSILEARGGGRGGGRGGRGGHGGWHRGGHRGGWHGGHRGWHGRGWRGYGWGRPYWGVGLWPSVVVSDTVSSSPQRPASLDAFISEFGRQPYSAQEFCNWVNQTGRSPRQCRLYQAYIGY